VATILIYPQGGGKTRGVPCTSKKGPNMSPSPPMDLRPCMTVTVTLQASKQLLS